MEIDPMKKDTNYVIVRGEVGDIDSIVQFQADMAMESEGCVLDKERVTKGVTAAMLDDSKGIYWVAKSGGDTYRKPDAHPRMERLEQRVVLVDSERLRDTRAQATRHL